DILLSGSRAVPGLQAGDSNGGWAVTVTVPVATPLGTYHLIACADDAKAIAEVDEGNNCTATNSTVQVTLPDLVEKGVTGVPASIQRGKAFVATDTVSNAGAIGAGATTTRYYLSKDTAKGVGDILVTGMRAVPALA